MKFAEGQSVWVFNSPRVHEAVVRTFDGFTCKCTFSNNLSYLNNTFFPSSKIFARPEGLAELLEQLRHDAETLTDAAEKLERENKG